MYKGLQIILSFLIQVNKITVIQIEKLFL